MLKNEMIEKLNAQMNLELYSSLLYQQMSAWCSYHSFEGAAAFLRRHAQEEMTHMQRLFDYLTDTGSLPSITAIASPVAEYTSLDELFRATYEHEQLITQKINELAHAAMTSQIIQHLISCSGTLLNSTKKRNCLNPLLINCPSPAKAAKACILLIKSWQRSIRKINKDGSEAQRSLPN